MAKYRARAALYVGSRLIGAGDVFQSDDVPGLQWEPLDDDGRSAYERKHAKPGAAKVAAKPEAKAEPADDGKGKKPAADKKDA
jgi:hypothetical protein